MISSKQSNAMQTTTGQVNSGSEDAKVDQFEQIRKECHRRRQRFEDPEFPANDQSIYYSSQPGQKFEWLRPDQVCYKYQMKPEFLRMGSSPNMRFDVVQGDYGDCWLLSAFGAISENEELLFRVVPRGQSFNDDWYAGIFRFRIWRTSQWEDVIIDDRLPTVNGQPVFIHSQSIAEFWPALLEKAFAKLYGSYEALKSALIGDSLTDLTGGLTESYVLHGNGANLPKNIINVMFKALERESIISCSINSGSSSNSRSGSSAFTSGQRQSNGLIVGHTYCVTDLREIRLITQTGEIPFVLVRLRNPWGSRVEWNGAWSERSEEWQSIPDEDRREMGLVVRNEAEFWMEFHDFLTNFDSLDLCNLAPDAPVRTPRRWSGRIFNGRWIKGANAGGRPENRDSHWTNPQVRLWLRELDDDEEGLCSVLVELTQKDERLMKYRAPNYVHIGFSIYQLPPSNDSVAADDAASTPQSPQQRSFFDTHQIIAHSGCFPNSRQVTRRFLLAPGDYLLVLATYEPNISASFSVRCFFEKPGNSAQLMETATELINPQSSLLGPPLSVAETLPAEQHERLRWLFYESAGEEMRIPTNALPQLLAVACQNEFEINQNTARLLSLLVDTDRTGFVEYGGFAALFRLVSQWRRSWFENHSNERSMALEASQLGPALQSLGYKLPSRVIAALLLLHGDQKMSLTLDAFIAIAARLYQAGSTFKKLQHNGRLVLNLEQWFEESLAA